MQLKAQRNVWSKVMLIIALICLVLLVLFLNFIRSPWNSAFMFDQMGYIKSGTFVGVDVGMDQAAAIDSIKTRFPEFEFVGPNTEGNCSDFTLEGDEFIQLYDSTWRGGLMCMSFENQKVTSIAWIFKLGI